MTWVRLNKEIRDSHSDVFFSYEGASPCMRCDVRCDGLAHCIWMLLVSAHEVREIGRRVESVYFAFP